MMKSIFALAEVATIHLQYYFIKYVNCKKLQRVHYWCIREFDIFALEDIAPIFEQHCYVRYTGIN